MRTQTKAEKDVADLIKAGKYEEAFDKEASEYRKKFGNEYDEQLKEAKKHFLETVVPKIKK